MCVEGVYLLCVCDYSVVFLGGVLCVVCVNVCVCMCLCVLVLLLGVGFWGWGWGVFCFIYYLECSE